jgi:hypothetical protein
MTVSDKKIPKGVKTALNYLIGAIFALFIFMGVVTLFGKLKKTEVDCWSVQFKDERAFKVNSCNGSTIELDKKSMEPKT